MYNTILVTKEDRIAVITLNRPQRLNAWTNEMSAELQDAVIDCNDDENIGAMVVTGAGRGFCAGADIKDSFKARLEGQDSRPTRDWVELVRSSKPMIAAVNGACVGVGATMILPMDVIVASEQAKFGMLFIKMGVTPELASSHFLAQRVGFGKASEMCLTARLYDGREAEQLGLADRLSSADDLLNDACELARQIAANPAPHLRWVKELLTANIAEPDIKMVQKREGEVLAKAYASVEHQEAVNAFIEKRSPNFHQTKA